MASTNKTAHLALNQWVLSDPLMMEDVNEDNRKIDAALGGLPYVKLLDITTTADAQQVDLDVSGIDFSQFAMVQLFSNAIDRKTDSSSNNSDCIKIRINGSGDYFTVGGGLSTSSVDYVAKFSINHTCGTVMRADIFGFQQHPAADDNNKRLPIYVNSMGATLAGISYGYAVRYMNNSSQFRVINFLTDSPSFKIKVGSKFVMYGVRI